MRTAINHIMKLVMIKFMRIVMRVVMRNVIIFGALVLSMALPVQANDLAENLRSSSYVLLMRHASAPGVGDPPNYKLDDCKTQRNLDTEGRRQAVVVGDWLRKQGIQSANVFSSIWCRCKETAALLNFNGYRVEPSLGSFFDEMAKARESNRALQRLIAEHLKTKGDRALILVTHHVNILEFSGENVASGDMVLVKVDASGNRLSHEVIPRPGDRG
ncbi:MAG: histidine phosphatase family protein [Betaproteobacteria bacterium]|nr:histidine phosphatase family protein [Betaproteobacteria bacterium]